MSKTYSITKNFIKIENDDEIVFMPVESEKIDKEEFFTLNELGKEIFLLIENKIKVEKIVQLISQKYDIQESIAKKDIDIFLKQLIMKEILIADDK